MEIPIVDPVGAGLLITRIVNPRGFRSGRLCAAWVGLSPKNRSTGGKQRLGGITRAGDEGLRAVLVSSATAYIKQVRRGRMVPSQWLATLLERKPPKLAAVALTTETVHMAWKLMTSGGRYNPAHRVDREGPGTSLYGGLRTEPLAPSPQPAAAALSPPENFRVTAF